MSDLAALPLVVLAASAAGCLLAWRAPRAQRAVVVLATLVLLAAAIALVIAVARDGPIRLQVGGWPAPFGIQLRADMLSAVMVLITAVIGAAVAIYAVVDVGRGEAAYGFYPLVLLLLLGVCGAFLTADLFNLYVWFEVMLIASFVLLGLGGRRAQLRGGLIYVTLNLISSALFLIGVGLVYGAVRTLDMDHIAARMAALDADQPLLALALQALLMTSFGLKAAVFPLFFWLPASYHTPSPSVSALFAALLTKVGVYSMFRVTAGVFPAHDALYAGLVVISAGTMLTGVLGALAQDHVRRILSFHIISQIGYMVAGLAVAGADGPGRRFALAAGIFYVLHHILVKTNLFLVAGVVRRLRGTEALDRLGGMARARPWLAGAFLISALSLAGMPPLSGFWAKLAIFRAGLDDGQDALVAVAVVTGLLTLLSMLKIWSGVFAGEPPDEPDAACSRRELAWMAAPIAALAGLTLAIGLYPEPLFELALVAATQLTAGASP